MVLSRQRGTPRGAPRTVPSCDDDDDDDDELHIPVAVFSTWRQMADRLPREGRKNATKPAHAVPLASARQHLDVETQAGHSSERAVEGQFALPREQSTPGFSNSRIRALPHVHLRSPGSRPSS